MLNSLPFLWQGLLVTLQVSALVVGISLVLGVLLGVAISFGPLEGVPRPERSTSCGHSRVVGQGGRDDCSWLRWDRRHPRSTFCMDRNDQCS
jgi:hypothetical protein